MQRGTIRSYDKGSASGMISCGAEPEIRFYSDRVIGRDRSSLAQGDQVWFEMEQVNHLHVAVNIRKCS